MKTLKMLRVVSAVLVLSAATLPAADKGGKAAKGTSGAKGQSTHPSLGEPGKRANHMGSSKSEGSASVHLVFDPNERKEIQRYVDRCLAVGEPGRNVNSLPPGLAKKVARGGELPPGWQKKCVVGEIMPLEVFQRCHSLPHDLVVRLPPSPPGIVLVAIDGRVVRVHKATREIHAVFEVSL